MQILIDIDEKVYEDIKKYMTIFNEDIYDVAEQILNGIILPKGHGRLIDADALKEDTNYSNYDGYYHAYSTESIYNAPTIIEAEVLE